MEKQVSESDLNQLRQKGLLKLNETALIVGDVMIAENLLTKERRILDVGNLLLESTRRILKG
tara:strand:- start:2613 stop:2798 length:186 start_codon:yes stop_codon:yes gene_type:complete